MASFTAAERISDAAASINIAATRSFISFAPTLTSIYVPIHPLSTVVPSHPSPISRFRHTLSVSRRKPPQFSVALLFFLLLTQPPAPHLWSLPFLFYELILPQWSVRLKSVRVIDKRCQIFLFFFFFAQLLSTLVSPRVPLY